MGGWLWVSGWVGGLSTKFLNCMSDTRLHSLVACLQTKTVIRGF